MKNEEAEKMAREYKQALALSSDESTTVEQLILLEENQLDLLNDLSSLRSPLTARTVGYLKNLIFRSLQQLNALVGNTSYIPAIRSRTTRCIWNQSRRPRWQSHAKESGDGPCRRLRRHHWFRRSRCRHSFLFRSEPDCA